RDVGGDEDARGVPEGVVRGQRFGVGDVEDGAQAAGAGLGEQGLGVDDGAAGGVEEDGAVLHGGEEVLVGQVAGLGGEGQHEGDHVLVRQEGREVGHGDDAGAGAAGHQGDAGAERLQAGAESGAEVTGADDEHPLVPARVGGVRRPAGGGLLLGVGGQAAGDGQQGGGGPFGDGGTMGAGRARQGEVGGQAGPGVGAGAEGLDEAERGEPVDEGEDAVDRAGGDDDDLG